MLVKRNRPCSLKPLPLFQGLGPKWDCWALLQFGMGIFWSGTVWIWKVNFCIPSNQGSPIQAFTMLYYDIAHPHIQRFWWWWPNNDDDDAFVRVHLHPFTNYDEDDDYNDDDDHVDDDNDYDEERTVFRWRQCSLCPSTCSPMELQRQISLIAFSCTV